MFPGVFPQVLGEDRKPHLCILMNRRRPHFTRSDHVLFILRLWVLGFMKSLPQ